MLIGMFFIFYTNLTCAPQTNETKFYQPAYIPKSVHCATIKLRDSIYFYVLYTTVNNIQTPIITTQ